MKEEWWVERREGRIATNFLKHDLCRLHGYTVHQ